MNILIVDDQIHASDRIRASLSALDDIQTIAISDPRFAMDLMSFGLSADVALIDLRFGESSHDESTGLAICQKLHLARPNMVIVGYSSVFSSNESSNVDLKNKFFDMGADAVRDLSHLTLTPAVELKTEFLRLRDSRGKKGTATQKPKIFVGSSKESVQTAILIQSDLRSDNEVHVWTQTAFGLGSTTIESLESAVEEYQFAIFVMTRDDSCTSRDVTFAVPRDNVVFEAGLFIGRLGRNKTFLVTANNSEGSIKLKLPSDLHGVMTARFDPEASNLSAELGPVCQLIRDSIRRSLASSH